MLRWVQYATVETFERARSIITQMLFPAKVPRTVQPDAPKIATLDEPQSDSEFEADGEYDEDDIDFRWGWMALTPRDKLELLACLADLAMTSRGVRAFMDECDSRLTTLRKEKIEVNRERKRV